MMKKLFLGILVAAFAMGSVLLFSETGRAETINLKLAHFMGPMHVQHSGSFVPFAQKVEKLSGGKVKIKIYPGGSLGGPKSLVDAVASGITDMAFILPGYMAGRFPRSSVFDLPFIFENGVQATKVFYDIYDKYLAEDYKGIKILWFYVGDPGQILSRVKPVQKVGDLKGMKLRAHSAQMTQATKLFGANPVGMPISKLYISLEKGIVDGAMTTYSAMESFQFYDLVKYITEANIYVPIMGVIMDQGKFNSLPDFAKKAIDEASGLQWALHSANVYVKEGAEAKKKIKEQDKIKILTPSASEIQQFREKLKGMEASWVKKMSQKGLPAKEILEATYRSAEKHK